MNASTKSDTGGAVTDRASAWQGGAVFSLENLAHASDEVVLSFVQCPSRRLYSTAQRTRLRRRARAWRKGFQAALLETLPPPPGLPQLPALAELNWQKPDEEHAPLPPPPGLLPPGLLDGLSLPEPDEEHVHGEVRAEQAPTTDASHVPVAMLRHPLATLIPLDEAVPVVDLGESEQLRCGAYCNPFFVWGNYADDISKACNELNEEEQREEQQPVVESEGGSAEPLSAVQAVGTCSKNHADALENDKGLCVNLNDIPEYERRELDPEFRNFIKKRQKLIVPPTEYCLAELDICSVHQHKYDAGDEVLKGIFLCEQCNLCRCKYCQMECIIDWNKNRKRQRHSPSGGNDGKTRQQQQRQSPTVGGSGSGSHQAAATNNTSAAAYLCSEG